MFNFKRFFRKALSLITLTAILFCAVGCTANPAPVDPGADPYQGAVKPAAITAVNLMAGIISKNTATPVVPSESSSAKAADFAVRLFKACFDEKGNTLVSPLSVLAALSMTANGAQNETLHEMEAVLGMPLEQLNEFYFNYAAQLKDGEKAKLDLANSIWFTADERFTVNGDFLQKNADVFGADVYKAPFDDGTRQDVNNWVKEHTDGMIPEILGPDIDMNAAVMFLVNALAFDAEWESVYHKDEVDKGEFTKEDGTKQNVELMYSEEGDYLITDNAEGFIKTYKGGRYAFAALLPNEGVTVDELVASLDGEKLMGILNGAANEGVRAAIPKFESEYSARLDDVLSAMGMPSAFKQEAAEFEGLGTSTAGNIFIDRVLHKTFISVDERGTRAGAATAVVMADECAALTMHSVILDRPFVYMLIDTQTNLPFFIGTLTDVG